MRSICNSYVLRFGIYVTERNANKKYHGGAYGKDKR